MNIFPDDLDKLGLPVYFSVGLHPWNVQGTTWEKQVEKVKTAAGKTCVLAIGETGLDKTVNNPFEIQQQAFAAHISIAESLKKPIVIHCVRSYSEMLAIRKKSDLSVPWIFHWFNADEQIAAELVRKNCFLSFGHMLFNEQSKAFRVFKTADLRQVFFETDDAGCTIREVYAQAAGIRKMQVDDLRTRIMDNFASCFHQ